MNLKDLHGWIASQDGLAEDFTLLWRVAAARNLRIEMMDPQLQAYRPNWKRLLLAASLLASSDDAAQSELALMTAHAGLLLSDSQLVKDASATLLAQLSNTRAIRLAIQRELLRGGFQERLGIFGQMLLTKREIEQTIILPTGEELTTNHFQRSFWQHLRQGRLGLGLCSHSLR